jgi:hypothetical protein
VCSLPRLYERYAFGLLLGGLAEFNTAVRDKLVLVVFVFSDMAWSRCLSDPGFGRQTARSVGLG